MPAADARAHSSKLSVQFALLARRPSRTSGALGGGSEGGGGGSAGGGRLGGGGDGDGGGDDGDGGGDSGGGGGGGDEVVAAATNTTERCGGGIGTQQACELCGLAPTGAIRSPFAAVRAAAERTQPERAYALQPNELREAAEDDGAALLSAHGLCHALAAKKGFQRGKGSSAPDAHRAGLLLVRVCAEGALLFASQPPDEVW